MMRDQKLWTWHLAAGAVILVFLGLHMTVMHLDKIVLLASVNPAGGHPIDWQNVLARGKSAAFAVTYVVLLGAALFHGLYGLRNILFELDPARGLKRAISAVLLIVGIGLFVVGTWAAIASHTLAKAM
ncbi:MAG: putative rane protein [Acidobacteria bacterium]|jgi:succinate dehydrogenase / fumarate reductase membrane anchor subunit|nr:putative rane protein [Acidobacteriota bacterium]